MKIKWFKWLLFCFFSFLLLWTAGISSLSFVYTYRLLHPTCPKTIHEMEDFQAVRLQTSDGLELQGWWQPPQNGVVILLLGGLGSNKDTMLPEAEFLTRHGYGILSTGYRYCTGEPATLGESELLDIEAMLDYAGAQEGVEHLGVLGFSVGGTVAIRAATRHPELEAVIALGNFANLKEEITTKPARVLSIRWQVQRLVLLFFRLLSGVSAGSISPVDEIPLIAPRPILFIHGENEIERTQGLRQYQAGQPNADLWIVPSSGHGEYRSKYPQEYKNRIIQFLDKAFHKSGL